MRNFTSQDRMRICEALYYSQDKLPVVEDAMKRLETSTSDAVQLVLNRLDNIETIQNNLDNEMGTNQGAMIKAGPLEWRENRFKQMISALRSKVQQLGIDLGLEPNLTVLNDLAKQYGLISSITGTLGRS